MDEQKFRAVYERAVKAWNRDDGAAMAKTIKSGEDLFFASADLITELTEQNERLYDALQDAVDFIIEIAGSCNAECSAEDMVADYRAVLAHANPKVAA